VGLTGIIGNLARTASLPELPHAQRFRDLGSPELRRSPRDMLHGDLNLLIGRPPQPPKKLALPSSRKSFISSHEGLGHRWDWFCRFSPCSLCWLAALR
jgi:hypothetical protein